MKKNIVTLPRELYSFIRMRVISKERSSMIRLIYVTLMLLLSVNKKYDILIVLSFIYVHYILS